ncbi:MAG: hypothetical protein LBI49_01080 [Nocardiopsaceae bacterium]|jgi:hypothetical protein|nr:hypothetical protein [Nocardiopsaceae bacterium]
MSQVARPSVPERDGGRKDTAIPTVASPTVIRKPTGTALPSSAISLGA